jgi:hypothetical protein
MKPSREFFWRRVAMEFDKLNVALLRNRSASLEEGEREYLAFQKKLLRQVETRWEHQHLRRITARSILTFAFSRARTWEEYERALRRVRRLGYLDARDREKAATFTLLFAARRAPDKAPLGWAMLEDAERRLRRIRRGHHLREEGLESIALARQQVAQRGLLPPSPMGTSRRRASSPRPRLLPPMA